jgi:hypothetical protein
VLVWDDICYYHQTVFMETLYGCFEMAFAEFAGGQLFW